MRRVVAALIVAVLLIQLNWIADAQGQASCTFKLGFATLRDLVGAQKIGNCLEDEHFNEANGNAEQRTSGGLLVWRKVDNFTAFTDGGTTWVNGPNGLQSRPNSERFAWERDPLTAPSAGTSASSPSTGTSPSSSSSSPSTIAAPPRSAGSPVASINSSAGSSSDGLVADASPTSTPTKVPTATPAATATSVATPTKTPNPVTVKFTDGPDDVDTGSDEHIRVETNAKKGTCSLTVTYNNSDPGAIGTANINDGACEWTFNLPQNTKTGQAKAQVTVSGENGTASIDNTFDVNKGDTIYTGDVNVELELTDSPDDATVGESIKVAVQTNMKKKGTCNMSVAWPKVAATGGEQKTPDNDGKCSWTMVVPTVPKKGTATLTVSVADKDGKSRSVTKEFDVKPT